MAEMYTPFKKKHGPPTDPPATGQEGSQPYVGGKPMYVHLDDESVNPLVQAIRDGLSAVQLPSVNVPELKVPDIDVSVLTNVISANMEIFGQKMADIVGQIPQAFGEALKGVTNAANQILEILQVAYPIIRVIASSMSEWSQLQDRMQASGQDLSSPDLDPVLASQVTALMAVPGVGQMVRGAVNYAHMARYQQLTGRGFASDLDQLYWLANGPSGAVANGIDQAVSKIPAFFLR